MFKIKGQCEIGGSINVRTEMHGKENVPAMDIPCTMLITRKQLSLLLREDLAPQALFNEKSQGVFEPLFGGRIGAIPVLGKFPKAEATFKLGLNEHKVSFEVCTIAKMKIDPQVGGMTTFQFTIQVKLEETGKAIFDFANSSHPAEVSLGKLDAKKDTQQELPMGDNDEAGPADKRLDEMLSEDGATPAKVERVTPKKRVRPSRSKAAIAERELKANGADAST